MKRLMSAFLIALMIISTPVQAMSYGITSPKIQTVIKQKKFKLRKMRVGKTILIYDSKISKKHIKFVKKSITTMPKNVQKSAKKVYFLRKKYFKMSVNDTFPKMTVGYAILDDYREIYLHDRSNLSALQHTLWHEFGHTFDSRKKTFGSSKAKKWIAILKSEYPHFDSEEEYFADIFADFIEFITEPENQFIASLIYKKGK